VNKIVKVKLFQFLFFPFLYLLIIIIDVATILSFNDSPLIIFISLILTYTATIFQIFFFLKGLKYFNFRNLKQDYFFCSILASGILVLFFSLLAGISIVFDNLVLSYIWMSLYILHTKFISYFGISNSIIIQNNYFDYLAKSKRKMILILSIFIIVLGIFSSLRALRFG